MRQPHSSKHSKRTIDRVQYRRGAPWRLVTQLMVAAQFMSAKKLWNSIFAALLMLPIHAPARADLPCSGGENSVARPIATTLQPNASAFNPDGRVEVTMQSTLAQTTDIYVRHSVGSNELFRAITRLQSTPSTVVVGRLPAGEGPGFSLLVEEGGSGYREICTYGFRFQQYGVVSYRTLAARAETRGGGIFAGEVTDWKSVAKPPALVSQTHSFDGTYYHEGLRFGFSVTGDQGIATVSNSPKYKPGDVMLRFTPSSPKAFAGQQLCTDGVFHPVTGTLADDASIDMAIQGCFPSSYKMVRQGTPASDATGTASAGSSPVPLSISRPSTPTSSTGVGTDGTELTTRANATQAQIAAARKYWIYGALSNNVYPGTQISLPVGWQSLYPKYGIHGFYAETFIRKENGKIRDIVVAFRGTDGLSPYDWAFGNLFNLQQGDANEYAGEVIAKLGRFGSVKFTGHSLGGALAQNVANNLGKEAIVFDSSPMDGFDYPTSGGSKIVRISEESEALEMFRLAKLADVTYNFIDNREGKIANHAVYPLAAGMKELALSDEFPPMPFIDYGYQVDLVTGKWRLKRGHTLFDEIADKPRAIGTLNADETVVADQIAIRTFNYEIYEVNEPTVEKFWNHVMQKGVIETINSQMALKKGDRIAVLSYFGEGECRVWFKGNTYVAVCPTITGAVDNQLTKRKSEIWARVVTNKGQRGYLRDPDALGMSKHD